MLNVLTFSTLYPNPAQPNFGGFVERQTLRLAARADVALKVIVPFGRFPLPLGRYAASRSLPRREIRGFTEVFRPSFPLLPVVGWRFNPKLVAAAAAPVVRDLIGGGFRPDVIDCEFFYPDGPAAVAIGRAFGIPVSIKARGSDIRLWGRRPAALRAMREAADAAGGLLAVSQALKADMTALGMPAARVRVHLTGVALDKFHPIPRAAAKAARGLSGPVLLAVGNLVPLKRQALIVAAAQRIPDAQLLIAGEGPERPRLQATIDRLGLGHRARLLGAVPHSDMPGLMAAADVLVHAAESEGLANVWIEALACGTPVVAANVGGAAEVIDRPEAGRLLDAADGASLAAAILDVMREPPPPEAVRQCALRFDWARNTDTLYEHLSGLKRQ